MARRNLLRSLAAASLLAVTSGALLAGAAMPAAAVDNNIITVTVTDTGFSQNDIQARVGDHLIFRLDDNAQEPHTLAWDRGQIRFQFSRPGHTSTELPMNNAGKASFFDSDHVGPNDPPGPFAGTLTVTDAPPQPPDTTSSSTSTTVTTAPQSTSTTVTTARPVPTTTVFPPTTQTTGVVAIHPMLVSDPTPAPTTTTTAPKKKDNGADKGKAKAAAAETPTTAAPAPPGPDPVFDPSTLTPSPLPSPGGDITAVVGSGDGENLDASAAASLLNPDKAADDTGLLLLAIGALALVLVAGVIWGWHHRSSRYFPA